MSEQTDENRLIPKATHSEAESPENNHTNSEPKGFIRETVGIPGGHKGKLRLVRFAILVCSAVLFGVVACLSFLLTKPWLEDMLGLNETEAEVIVIPRDEETQAAETEPATTEASAEAILEQQVEELVNARMDSYLATLEVPELTPEVVVESPDDRDTLAAIQDSLAHSLVQVTSRSAEEDVFRNIFTHSEQTFGVITALTENEALILTENTLIEDSDAGVYVTLGAETVNATVRGTDRELGMAVVAVAAENLPSEIWEQLTPVKLGNSYSLRQGDFVAALGRPLAYTGSALAGSVAYVNPLQQGTDLNFRLIQTDMACDQEAAGILVNEAGYMLGWITQRYNGESMSGMLAAMSVSELKGSLEKMTNGKGNASLGIRYLPVDAETAEAQQIPVGLYLTKCMKESPASEAGIQSGDILTVIDKIPVNGELDFRRYMEARNPGDSVEVTVMRQGKNGFAEQTYTVTLGTH